MHAKAVKRLHASREGSAREVAKEHERPKYVQGRNECHCGLRVALRKVRVYFATFALTLATFAFCFYFAGVAVLAGALGADGVDAGVLEVE